MEITRRKAILLAAVIGLAPLSKYASADDKRHALFGTWHVRCPDGHVDVVTKGTRQHKCDECGKQCFVNNKVTVMCPRGHANVVDLGDVDVLTSYKCTASGCGAECQGW